MSQIKRVVLKKTRGGGRIVVYRHAARGGSYVSAHQDFGNAELPSAAVKRLIAAGKLT